MITCEQCGNDFDDRKATCPFCGYSRTFRPGRKAAPAPYRTVSLKENLPTVEEALADLKGRIRSAKSGGTRAFKFIHGYGSSGKGGAIGRGVRAELRRMVHSGDIAAFVPGEEFFSAEPEVQRLLRRVPELRKDRDLNRRNPGITLVVL